MASAVPPGSAIPPGSPQGWPQQARGDTKDPARDLKDQAREMKDQARSVLDDAKGSAKAKLGEQQQAAATGVGDFARALRDAARSSGDSNTLAARAAETAAERLERLSGALKNKDIDSVVRDAESFARREPMLFLGVAVAAGFIAMRLLKGSAPQTDDIQRRM
jgi:ElaB/YqjD/DUF883 family membrane-anchored ribosome-binding protein